MSRSTRRAGLVAAAALLVGATVGGCQAGFDAFTSQPFAPSNGSVASAGDMRIRNTVVVRSDDGTQSQIYASFINMGGSPDTLTGVSIAGVGTVPLDGGSITVPAAAKVDLGPGGYQVFANNLTQGPGDVVTVTFRFEQAGEVHLSALIMTAQSLVSGG